MKESPKIRRLKLKISSDDDWIIFGIAAPEPDYKLSIALNRKFGISLRHNTPVSILQKDDTEDTFSLFSDSSDANGMEYRLISNRSGKNILINKMKNIDYFFLIRDIYKKTDPVTFLTTLRETDFVTAAFKIEPGLIKDRNINYLINLI